MNKINYHFTDEELEQDLGHWEITSLSKGFASSYKTLYGYVNKFRNVNKWFKNKPWDELTGDEIKQVPSSSDLATEEKIIHHQKQGLQAFVDLDKLAGDDRAEAILVFENILSRLKS